MDLTVKRVRSTMRWLLILACILSGTYGTAQNPVFKIDFNQTGRQDAEVLEPGYISWTLASSVRDTATLNLAGGVQVRLIRKGPYGDRLSTNWYKAGIDAPFRARLVCDGIRVNNGNSGAQVELRISGLPAGRHTLLTYHNNVDNPATNTFSPVDIYLDGVKKYEDLVPTTRETITSNVPVSYIYADAVTGQDVVILFAADTSFTANNKNLMINGLEINTANPQYLARLPFPKHTDEHVNADNGRLTLSWTNASNAVASRIYFGTDSTSVADATGTSALYKGRRTTTIYAANNQYSMSTYFWRIDQEDADGNITRGNIWYYRPRQLAFREAEGHGRYARGGRGGRVITVTNLNDNGPGSLRDAIDNYIGPRTIVFAVSGIIQLNSRLVLNKPYVTVAGQTAPGKGICIKSAPFGITGNDCIVRHMRVRVGSGITYDGMGLTGANYSIMDHCSISWTIDESFSSRGAKNITLQRTLISEALNAAGHANYPAGTEHGYAATIGGDTGSFHHNLLAHCYGRNWSLGGGLDGSGFYTGELDIRNNVVYNWGSRTTDGGAKEVNFVNNYYKPGAGTRHFFAFTLQHEGVGKGTQRCYFAGNVMPGRFNESNQETGRRSVNSNGDTSSYQTFVNAPFFESYVNTQSAKDAYKRVLSDVGATQPVFDDHDTRMVRETLDSTWSVTGSITGKPGFPDDEQDAGGWENYPEEARPANWDTDLDGLPDWFEQLKNSNINSAAGDFSDANKDQDKDGYTRLDEYLEFMGSEHYFARPFQLMAIDLSTFTRGYTNRPVFSVRNMNNGLAVQLPWDNGTLYFLTLFKGFASFTFTVRDAEGSSMTRTINIAVSDHPTLPVDDFNFTTSRQNPTTVSLTWENAKEIPFASYEIQRGYSIDGPFTSVTTVKGKLQSINTRSVKSVTYDLQDNNNYTGYTWYKLLLKDADGKVILTKLGVVEGSEADPSVKIWPVPSKGEFNLMLMDETVPVTVQIRRVDGAAVGKDELVYPRVSRTFTINVPGTYIITGVNKESGKQVFSSKVVIQ